MSTTNHPNLGRVRGECAGCGRWFFYTRKHGRGNGRSKCDACLEAAAHEREAPAYVDHPKRRLTIMRLDAHRDASHAPTRQQVALEQEHLRGYLTETAHDDAIGMLLGQICSARDGIASLVTGARRSGGAKVRT